MIKEFSNQNSEQLPFINVALTDIMNTLYKTVDMPSIYLNPNSNIGMLHRLNWIYDAHEIFNPITLVINDVMILERLITIKEK